MQAGVSDRTFENIHFPQRLNLIKSLRAVSFVINDVVLFVSVVVFFVWLTNITVLKDILFEKLYIIPETSLLFILACTTLFFASRGHINKKDDLKNEVYPWWNTFFPILFAATLAVLGLISLLKINFMGLELHISPIEGFCFLLIGLSLIPPFTRIPHRFHITQLLVFIVSGLSVYVVLENIYQIFAEMTVAQSILIPLSLALTFAFFSFGILLRWSGRGFFGNFTLDSTGSMFAFRIFLINLISAPLIAFLVIIALPKDSYNVYQTISLIVVFLTFISSLLIWLNLRFLYRYELEHLLMRESLHAHNIDLKAEKDKLEEKMLQIEQEKKQYKSQLKAQTGWQNAVDNTS